MPRVTFVKKARKDNPCCKKGESYYWWAFRHGGKHYSKTRPRQSQLTQSDKLSRFYACQENVEDACNAARYDSDLDGLRDMIETTADELREIADEYQESCDNIRDSFENSPTADECEEKADCINSVADELEGIDFDLDDEPQLDTYIAKVEAEVADNPDNFTAELIEEAKASAEDEYEADHDEWEQRREEVIDEVENVGFDLY